MIDPYNGASNWERGIKWQDIIDYVKGETKLNTLPEGMEILRVVGVSFVPDYPANLYLLIEARQELMGDVPVRLVRNPDNKFDSNAVEVRWGSEMLGHLSRDVAARVAPLLDNGADYDASVYQVLVNPENPEHPGLDILVDWSLL